jgi:molecular chaperone DnaK (HSP70)
VSDASYVIGIDLGTTNSVVAYARIQDDESKRSGIRVFDIPQLVGPGEIGAREMLPSTILIPGPHELPEDGLALPWNASASLAVGEFARDRGAELPHRLISSAKSWLCHTGVDRNKPILPWEGEAGQPRFSPVAASAEILRHIKDAWNHVMAGQDESMRIEKQEIFLTVPASFDVVARNLTVEAARMAGLSDVILLEEPQAAFYSWIDQEQDKWREHIRVGDVVLVVDVGGGTTDFSLIRVAEDQGELTLDRIAVGEHVLVGGDNMDLTLAYALAARMASQGQKLSAHQVRGLCHACRMAKEHLLKNTDLTAYPISILGRGSRLIGGTIKTELTREEVDQVLKNGFFPLCSQNDRPETQRRTGMRELGLSYSSDPAVTRHLARFLSGQASEEAPEKANLFPTAVLFNGGVMKALTLRRSVLDLLASWSPAPGAHSCREVENRCFDLAVARGAAYYGLARRGKGIRIRGGLSMTYYIGVEAAMPAVPGIPAPVKALCVAPFGMEEGSEAVIPKKEFGLVVGEPVKFDFLGSHTRHQDNAGAVIEDWAGEIEEITTLETNLDGETGAVLPVTLRINATEIGTLEIWCVSTQDDRKFRLEFNVRAKESGDA